MSEDVSVKIGAESAAAEAALARIKTQLEGLNVPLAGLAGAFRGIGGAITAAMTIATAAVVPLMNRLSDLGEQTQRTASILGVSTEQVGSLRAMAEITGTSFEGLSRSIERMQAALGKGKAETSQQAAALEAMGLNAQKFMDMGVDKKLEVLAEKFSKYEDGPRKVALAMALLSRSGAELIPFLNEGTEGFRKMREEIERTGSQLTKGQAAQFDEVGDKVQILGLSVRGLAIDLGAALAPGFQAVVEVMTRVVQALKDSAREGGILQTTFAVLGGVVRGIAVAFAIAAAAAQTFVVVGTAAVNAFSEGFTGAAKKAVPEMERIVGGLMTTLKAALSTPLPLTVHASGGAAPSIPDLSGRSAEAMKQLQHEIALERIAFATKKSLWDHMVDTYRMTNQQRYFLVSEATQKEYEKEVELIQKQLQLNTVRGEHRQELLNKLAIMEANHRKKMMELDQEAYMKTRETVGGFIDSLSQSFNSSLRQLLAGTMKFSDAAKKMLGDFIIFAIQEGMKYLVWEQLKTAIATAFHVQSEATKTAATTTGVAARTSAEAAGSSASLLTIIPNIIKSIFNSASQTFAGVMGFLSPIMGPAAAGPAAASAGTVASLASSVAAFDVGAWNIPREGLAMLHPREAVLPAPAADAFRNFAARGGRNGDVHINLSAHDTRSGADWLIKHKRDVGRAIRQLARNNNSPLPQGI